MIITIGHRQSRRKETPLVIKMALKIVLKEHSVAIVVSDPKSQATVWVNERPTLKLAKCFVRTGPYVDTAIRELQAQYDYVIIDAAGRDFQELLATLAVSEAFIIPVAADNDDVHSMPIVNEAKKLNPKLSVQSVEDMEEPKHPFKREVIRDSMKGNFVSDLLNAQWHRIVSFLNQ